MMRGLYKARYMIALMGFFGVYMGFIYNDIFSMPLNIFGTSYEWSGSDDDHRSTGAEANLTSSYGDADNVYPFGVDPAWHIADNELLFFNSLKMKFSVIIGVIQMTCGLLLRGSNAIYFGHMSDFWLEFLPMLIFDLALFGYMVILIFVKWNINWDYRMDVGTCSGGLTYDGRSCSDSSSLSYKCSLDYGGSSDGCQPPSLITTLINIALKPGDVDEPMYDGQASLQTVLLLVAFICVPIILFGKPYVLWKAHQEKLRSGVLGDAHDVENRGRGDSVDSASHLIDKEGEEEEEFNMNEIFVHQAIETIEFVLGMVSNTASYLRLWALSLAHTELATVFWEKAMIPTIEMNNPLAVVFGYAVFAGATTGVLLLMDVLECFLHALRLHWVEFQNKFYAADGHKFSPFDFKPILESDDILRDTNME
jgi:V-type H+-transporting ATPase subunit a